MAKFREIDEACWQDWVLGRPKAVLAVAARIRPDTLYSMKSTGHRVFPLSYSEDGTVTVAVTGQFNFTVFERQVFGVSPDDLEECDLPTEDEILGAVITEKGQVMEYLASIREAESQD